MSIELINVSKTYSSLGRHHTVFKNLNLTIPRGMSLGVVGPNGAGKSTLLRLIAGGEEPSSGRVNRNNMSISWPVSFSGFASQHLTGEATARFVARIYNRNPKEVAEFAADFAELGMFMKLPVKTYSSGMRARLGFALSMAIEFECLLMDEAGAVGDAGFRAKSTAALEERKKRCSVIMASHNLKEIVRLCDQVLVLGGPEPVLSKNVKRTVSLYAKQVTGREDAMALEED